MAAATVTSAPPKKKVLIKLPEKKIIVRGMTVARAGLKNNVEQFIPQIIEKDLNVVNTPKLKYEILSDQMVTLDHQKAAEYIDLPVFDGEREVAPATVQELYDQMRRKTFNPNSTMLATVLYNGVTYKLNGQHTCWAMIYMILGYFLTIREIRYKVNSSEQVRLLYSTYDRGRPRTNGHISKVFLVNAPATEGLCPSNLHKLASGYKLWRSTGDEFRRRVTPEQISAMVSREHPELFHRVGTYLQVEHGQEPEARRVAVLGAMFATFDKLPTKAPEFWTPVLGGLGLSAKSDPRYRLRDVLLRAMSRGGNMARGSKEGRRVLDTEDVYRMALDAWNKWRTGEVCRTALRVPKSRPRVL